MGAAAVADVRRAAPVLHDLIVSWAASAARRGAPGPAKRWAGVHEISRSRASRHLTGDPHSPTTHALALHYRLATDPRASAFPLLAEELVIVTMAEIESLASAELEQLHARLAEEWHDVTAEAGRTTHRLTSDSSADALEQAAAADVRVLELSMRRAAVRREIARRQREGRWS